MLSVNPPLSLEQCQKARIARDKRFDGQFFVGVKTTGIFCRPICPAKLPKEENVEYFFDKAIAVQSGYRPCLRCRPESIKMSCAWMGTETTLVRAVRLILDGELQHKSLFQLAESLGISDRYLRKLFEDKLGMSPKQYDLYNKLFFAKDLLHNSQLSIQDIGFAGGFNSTRRFNDAFKTQFKMTPTEVRNSGDITVKNSVILNYNGELNWQHMLTFYRMRAIKGLETVTQDSYARYVIIDGQSLWFKVYLEPSSDRLVMDFNIPNMNLLKPLINRVRRMFDLDTDTHVIEAHLEDSAPGLVKSKGLRIPGVWDAWEAGIRAVLGQQVSIKAAITQLNAVYESIHSDGEKEKTFPTPKQILDCDVSVLKMPQIKKDTLRRLAQFVINNPDVSPDKWIELKGVGPWTVNYALLRGCSSPDMLLDTDLIVKRELVKFPGIDRKNVSPWGSYATFHLWNQST